MYDYHSAVVLYTKLNKPKIKLGLLHILVDFIIQTINYNPLNRLKSFYFEFFVSFKCLKMELTDTNYYCIC
ncbi:hypothetical protein QTP88_019372 [Uroleucon formosanum]